jgi:hypothetical protein
MQASEGTDWLFSFLAFMGGLSLAKAGNEKGKTILGELVDPDDLPKPTKRRTKRKK